MTTTNKVQKLRFFLLPGIALILSDLIISGILVGAWNQILFQNYAGDAPAKRIATIILAALLTAFDVCLVVRTILKAKQSEDFEDFLG